LSIFCKAGENPQTFWIALIQSLAKLIWKITFQKSSTISTNFRSNVDVCGPQQLAGVLGCESFCKIQAFVGPQQFNLSPSLF
jgi:hypothetical protein